MVTRGRPRKSAASDDSERANGGTLQAVERALRLLEVLADSPRPRTLQDIADAMGCSVSTVHRLATTLTARHLAERDPTTGRLRLGIGVLRLAGARDRQVELHLIAKPYMDSLSERFLETVSLWTARGRQALCLAVSESNQEIRQYVEVGKAAHLSDLGAKSKVLLAAMADTEVDAVIRDVAWEHFQSTPAQLRAELETVRRTGTAMAIGGIHPDMAAVAAAVRDRTGNVVAALAIAGPRTRMDEAAAKAARDGLLSAANELSAELGFN